jgi:CHASE2 domain-containing sensor protein/tRNA A-37 threonylcarbamoyl transferase component Bud32
MKSPQPALDIVLDGKYRLEERLGEGATGVVYRAVHLGLKKAFAVKLLKAGSLDPLALARFRREAEALGQLRHPHVVEVTDFGIDEAAGFAYLVMELLDGSTLADFCRGQAPLSLERALPLLEAIAMAVDAAHARGVLHRDLKPGNVLLCPAPDGAPIVKVVDFGLAEIAGRPLAEDFRPVGEVDAGDRLTATGSLLGTPLYVAPELIRQQAASRASDLYSFGVIAYELLAGHPPFQGSTAEVLAGHLDAEPPVPALPEEVWQALREPLRKDPVQRPSSAGEIVRRLRKAADRTALARWRAAEIPRRVALSAGLTGVVLVAGLLLPWPAVPGLDNRVQDLRVRGAPARPPNPRIVLLSVGEASLEEGIPSLVDRADEIGATLERVFRAGARGVAIDLVLPEKWSRSETFSNLILRHPETLTLAAFSESDERVGGTDCVAGLTTVALGRAQARGLFGFVNLDEDADGVTRRGRLLYRDQRGAPRPSWAARAAEVLGSPQRGAANGFWIDPRIDFLRYRRIPWRDVAAELERAPRLFHDRLVLVGADSLSSGDDIHRVPHRAGEAALVSGLTLQALLADTIAAGFPVREPARPVVLAVATLLIGLALGAVLCVPRASPAVLALGMAAALYLAASFPVFWWSCRILPVSLPLLLLLFGLSIVLILRRMLPPAPEISS